MSSCKGDTPIRRRPNHLAGGESWRMSPLQDDILPFFSAPAERGCHFQSRIHSLNLTISKGVLMTKSTATEHLVLPDRHDNGGYYGFKHLGGGSRRPDA